MIQKNIVSEFIRYHPLLENASIARRIFPVIDKGKTIYLDLTSPETIWANLINKNRNNIHKAPKKGVQIVHSNDPGLFKEFMIMYSGVMHKNHASPYYYFKEEFYASIFRDLQKPLQNLLRPV